MKEKYKDNSKDTFKTTKILRNPVKSSKEKKNKSSKVIRSRGGIKSLSSSIIDQSISKLEISKDQREADLMKMITSPRITNIKNWPNDQSNKYAKRMIKKDRKTDDVKKEENLNRGSVSNTDRGLEESNVLNRSKGQSQLHHMQTKPIQINNLKFDLTTDLEIVRENTIPDETLTPEILKIDSPENLFSSQNNSKSRKELRLKEKPIPILKVSLTDCINNSSQKNIPLSSPTEDKENSKLYKFLNRHKDPVEKDSLTPNESHIQNISDNNSNNVDIADLKNPLDDPAEEPSHTPSTPIESEKSHQLIKTPGEFNVESPSESYPLPYSLKRSAKEVDLVKDFTPNSEILSKKDQISEKKSIVAENSPNTITIRIKDLQKKLLSPSNLQEDSSKSNKSGQIVNSLNSHHTHSSNLRKSRANEILVSNFKIPLSPNPKLGAVISRNGSKTNSQKYSVNNSKAISRAGSPPPIERVWIEPSCQYRKINSIEKSFSTTQKFIEDPDIVKIINKYKNSVHNRDSNLFESYSVADDSPRRIGESSRVGRAYRHSLNNAGNHIGFDLYDSSNTNKIKTLKAINFNSRPSVPDLNTTTGLYGSHVQNHNSKVLYPWDELNTSVQKNSTYCDKEGNPNMNLNNSFNNYHSNIYENIYEANSAYVSNIHMQDSIQRLSIGEYSKNNTSGENSLRDSGIVGKSSIHKLNSSTLDDGSNNKDGILDNNTSFLKKDYLDLASSIDVRNEVLNKYGKPKTNKAKIFRKNDVIKQVCRFLDLVDNNSRNLSHILKKNKPKEVYGSSEKKKTATMTRMDSAPFTYNYEPISNKYTDISSDSNPSKTLFRTSTESNRYTKINSEPRLAEPCHQHQIRRPVNNDPSTNLNTMVGTGRPSYLGLGTTTTYNEASSNNFGGDLGSGVISPSHNSNNSTSNQNVYWYRPSNHENEQLNYSSLNKDNKDRDTKDYGYGYSGSNNKPYYTRGDVHKEIVRESYRDTYKDNRDSYLNSRDNYKELIYRNSLQGPSSSNKDTNSHGYRDRESRHPRESYQNYHREPRSSHTNVGNSNPYGSHNNDNYSLNSSVQSINNSVLDLDRRGREYDSPKDNYSIYKKYGIGPFAKKESSASNQVPLSGANTYGNSSNNYSSNTYTSPYNNYSSPLTDSSKYDFNRNKASTNTSNTINAYSSSNVNHTTTHNANTNSYLNSNNERYSNYK